MLRLAPEPLTGIDERITAIQRHMFDNLRSVDTWYADDGAGGKVPILDTDWECYGRVQRIRQGDSYIASAYKERGEYADAFHDDTMAVVSFFGVGERTAYASQQFSVPVHAVFFVNLARVKPYTLHRADEAVRMDVANYFINNPMHGLVTRNLEIVTGIENVLAEYPGSIRDGMDAKSDMGQYHAFRINLTINYKIT